MDNVVVYIEKCIIFSGFREIQAKDILLQSHGRKHVQCACVPPVLEYLFISLWKGNDNLSSWLLLKKMVTCLPGVVSILCIHGKDLNIVLVNCFFFSVLFEPFTRFSLRKKKNSWNEVP
uniref:Uncharacterized protein n=1 Tax=Octopus bimaculoides TaxID=37653 RepID=A0A0L8FF91_OCTBM